MFNLNKVNTVYLACGITDLRKSIDGLVVIVQTQLKLDPFEKALFVFCNRQMNKIKILHFDEGFWLYYFRLENSKLKWLLMGYEVRTKSKFKPIEVRNSF
ncbi:hypothetical protein psyc5s11_33420 [Clostridium gelidum]|uniref:Transposase n=1 Tax=Clostridium gelidum TaxID=704125 RepID=A0ABN6IYQ9_9CLOT|nr:IS66 family insertion sequence element accessory protein TnpB [Clostridium gelidum]BCZ47275.1 hypothetical protein psyc5s11_33420 [Clostridium gelidum]